MTMQERFNAAAAAVMVGDPAVEQGRMLHAPGLRTGGRFFAFATPEDIVVKLPAARVRELIASGTGRPCVLRKAAPMREWVRLVPDNDQAGVAYLLEARDFVAHAEEMTRAADA